MLMANEHARQLEKQNSGMNILRKQLDLRERMSEVILLARTSPKGQIDVVFASKDYPKKTRPEVITDESRLRFSFFNTVERKGLMMRTVIVINPLWGDNIIAFQCQYGYTDLHLQTYEEILRKTQDV